MKRTIAVFTAVTALLLTGCSITENKNSTLTVVNERPQMGRVYLDGEPIPEVYSRSWFASVSVQLKAELSAVNRSYFDGWSFRSEQSSIDGNYSGSTLVKDNPVRIRIDESHRFAVARFCPEKHDEARFLSDELILFRSTTKDGVTWNATRHAGGNRLSEPVRIYGPAADENPSVKTFPNNQWALFSEKALWNGKTGTTRQVSLHFLSDSSVLGADNGNLLLLENGDAVTTMRLSLLNPDGGPVLTRTVSETPHPYDARDLFDGYSDGRRFSLVAANKNCEYRLNDTTFVLKRVFDQVMLVDVKGGTITDLPLPTPTGSNPILYETLSLVPDGSGKTLFAGKDLFGGLKSILALGPNGSKLMELDADECANLGISTENLTTLQWNANRAGIAWRLATSGTWASLDFGATLPVSIPGEPLQSGTLPWDRSLSPNGAWKLCPIESAAGDAIDVGIFPSAGTAANAVNLSIPGVSQ